MFSFVVGPHAQHMSTTHKNKHTLPASSRQHQQVSDGERTVSARAAKSPYRTKGGQHLGYMYSTADTPYTTDQLPGDLLSELDPPKLYPQVLVCLILVSSKALVTTNALLTTN